MESWQERAAKTAVGVVALVLVSTVVYHYVMIIFEGRDPTIHNSLRAVVETYTGTGFGADSPWESPVSNILISIMDLSTFLLVFIILPYVLRPVLEETFSPDFPESTDKTDHVVICGYSDRESTLTDELQARDVEHVVVDDDEETVRNLRADGVPVVYGDPTSVSSLWNANVHEASAVVVDTEDDEAASVVLSVRELNPDVTTVVLVRSLDLCDYLVYAGADTVLTPRHLLGRRMAERAETAVSPRLGDTVKLGKEFSLVELTVHDNSVVCGKRLDESRIRAETGASVVAAWKDDELVTAPGGDFVLEMGTVILVGGNDEQLSRLKKMTLSDDGEVPNVVVAGHGEVGSTVKDALRSSETRCVIIDIDDGEGVDIVGDATDEDTLAEAGIHEATAFVVAVTDDDQAILTTLVANELEADLDIIARVNQSENENKIRRAGADYVLSLPDITGRMLAREILDEEVLDIGSQLKIVRTEAPRIVGERLGEVRIRDHADCVVVAIERGDTVVTEITNDTVVKDGDQLLVAGSDEEIDRFETEFGTN